MITSRSGLTNGSPPVNRTSRTPSETARRISLTSSSAERRSSPGIQSSPSAGMQYVHRRLHRSVTDTRRSVATRPNASTSMFPGYLRCVFSLVRQPRWLGLLALTLILCVLFWWLGVWQWHRHETRSALNAAVHTAQAQPIAPLAKVMPDPHELPFGAEHRQVTASGRYLADAQLLERNPNGRAGFAVLTPMQLDTGGTLLVNRGF